MAIKKSELYSSLWKSCDELRGGMDSSQYKDYVLVLLFIKYISDKYADQVFSPVTIPKGASFKDLVALKGKATIGDDINKKIIAPLKEANKLSSMPDFNDPEKLGSGKEMVDKLTSLIAIFENKDLDFSNNRAENDDILGDAFEFLMSHFATESGKSKGQFYTPSEVSRIIAKIIGIKSDPTKAETSVYDPTCGSSSLLLKVADEASTKVSLFGQEKDASTSGLARMNMILHDSASAEIKQGNTLANPLFKNEQWQQQTTKTLKSLATGFHPKELIQTLSESLLLAYTDQPLLNKYDAYQHIMSYWAEVMQDDSYLIAADGWVAETYRIIEVNKKGKEIDKGWTCDLIPKSLLINRYFKEQQQKIDAQKAALESLQTERSELEEQHSAEEGFFTELDKINKAHVSVRLKELKHSKIDSLEEENILNEYLKLLLLETIQKKTIRDAEAELDNKLLNHYPSLSTEQIKQLVVDDKWMASIEQAIQTEMDRLSQKLTQRIKELAERYQTAMPELNQQVQTLEQTVNEHLAKMGF